MGQLRENVQAPQARPPLYGLIAAAPTVEDPNMRWLGGWAYQPEACGASGRLEAECLGNTESMTSRGRGPATVEQDPFLVYATDECSSFGFGGRDFIARARRQLAATESAEIAEELWTGSQLNDPVLASPGAPTLSTATTGGTLAAGTYDYRISAVDENGETLAGPVASLTIVGTGTSTITATWTAVTGAKGYNVYGRSGTLQKLTPVPITATTFTDTGANTPSGALPAANTTGNVPNRALAGPAADSDTVTSAAASPVVALACITAGLADTLRGQQGMVHMTPQLLTHMQAEDVVTRQGNLWVTAMGHIVVADAGYDGSGPGGVAAGATQWIYGTPVVQVRVGPIGVSPANLTDAQELAQALDRKVNTILVFAYRLAGFQWTAECAHLAAEVNVATCAIGGAA